MLFEDHNVFLEQAEAALKKLGLKLSAADRKAIMDAVSWRDPEAPPVIRKKHKYGPVEYEPDTELRDTEQVPFLEPGGIQAFFKRECLPYVPDAWIDESKTKIGYEIPLNRHFYRYEPPRELAVIEAEIKALEADIVRLLGEVTT